MLPRVAILALAAAVACAMQVFAAPQVSYDDTRLPLKKYAAERDKKYQEGDFLAKKTGFTYDWLEDIILQEKANINETIYMQPKYPTGAMIRFFKTAENLFTLMYKRVKTTRDFIEMANRDVFWYHTEKRFHMTRRGLDDAIKKCSGRKATLALTTFINDLKHKAASCSQSLIARAEVNEREFEFVARSLNKIYWKVEGCIGDAVRVEKPAFKTLNRKRRSFLKLFKKMGKKFIELSAPFLAGTAAGEAVQYGLTWLSGDDKPADGKPCIDANILNNTRINTQMLLYRSFDAIDLVNAAWQLENVNITTNGLTLHVKPMQICVRDKVKSQDPETLNGLLNACRIGDESDEPESSKQNSESDNSGNESDGEGAEPVTVGYSFGDDDDDDEAGLFE